MHLVDGDAEEGTGEDERGVGVEGDMEDPDQDEDGGDLPAATTSRRQHDLPGARRREAASGRPRITRTAAARDRWWGGCVGPRGGAQGGVEAACSR